MHDFLGQARKGGVNVLQHQLQHLMNVSQDKVGNLPPVLFCFLFNNNIQKKKKKTFVQLSRDRDPDLCACLRKAVLVNNILRRSNSLQLSGTTRVFFFLSLRYRLMTGHGGGNSCR